MSYPAYEGSTCNCGVAYCGMAHNMSFLTKTRK